MLYAAVATLGWRYRTLPRWLAIVTVPLALLQFANAVAPMMPLVLWSLSQFAPSLAAFLPNTLLHALSKVAPGEKEQQQSTKDHPPRSFEYHLKAVNLRCDGVPQQAEGRIP